MIKIIISTVLFIVFIGCNQKKEFVGFKNKDIQYSGRINLENDTKAILYWPGSSVKIRFKGKDISALLKDEYSNNYLNIILDEDNISVLKPDSIKKWYTLASNLDEGVHTLEIFKRTEWTKGKTLFYGFEIDDLTELLPPIKSNRTIEFFGNSITVGYANEDSVGNNPDSIYTNNYMSYAAITARHFDANYYCTARSGIGITISWFPLIMDELYYRLNPLDPNSKWDFSKVQPQIVVINLFQNDAWLTERPKFDEFVSRFGKTKPIPKFIINSYKNFVQKIRAEYPKAHIICTLGSMDATVKDSPWPGYIRKAVRLLNDKNIYYLFFPFHNIPGHPNINEHKAMAKQLIKFIDENFPDW